VLFTNFSSLIEKDSIIPLISFNFIFFVFFKSFDFTNLLTNSLKAFSNPLLINKSLLKLGLKPNYLSEETIIKLIYFALDNKKNIKTNNLYN